MESFLESIDRLLGYISGRAFHFPVSHCPLLGKIKMIICIGIRAKWHKMIRMNVSVLVL